MARPVYFQSARPRATRAGCCNLSSFMVFKRFVDVRLRSQLATPRSQLAALTLVAIVAAWFWALPPITTSLLYIYSTSWTQADLVRHLWHVRLVQPEWVGSPPEYDYLRWARAETLARLGAVSLGWIAGATWIMWRHLRGRTTPWPNKSLQPTQDGAGSSSVAGGAFWSRVPELDR